MNAPKRLCALTEPASHVDACLCDATTWRDKCNMPDFTCRERALIAGSGPQTVQKAHEYDARQTTSLFQHLRQKANCKTVRRRCPIKIAQLPVSAAADTDRDDGHATGDTSRNDCEIAQKRFGYNILLQPIAAAPWQPPPDYQGPLDNNDRNYNVIGQRVRREPAPPRALPLSQLGADSKANRCKSRYNVIGQRLLDPRHVCIRGPMYVDTRPYNVIGQPVFPPIPPPPPKQKPPDPLCLCTAMGL